MKFQPIIEFLSVKKINSAFALTKAIFFKPKQIVQSIENGEELYSISPKEYFALTYSIYMIFGIGSPFLLDYEYFTSIGILNTTFDSFVFLVFTGINMLILNDISNKNHSFKLCVCFYAYLNGGLTIILAPFSFLAYKLETVENLIIGGIMAVFLLLAAALIIYFSMLYERLFWKITWRNVIFYTILITFTFYAIEEVFTIIT